MDSKDLADPLPRLVALESEVARLKGENERLTRERDYWNKGHARHCAINAPCSVDDGAAFIHSLAQPTERENG